MKLLILALFIITSICSYAQTNQSGFSSVKNGYESINNDISLQQLSFHRQMAVQSTILYDTVRALTEINDPANADAYPWLSPDGLRLYFIRGTGGGGGNNQLMFAERPNTSSYFSTPVLVPLGLSNPTSCWLSNDELNVYICKDSTLYFADRSTSASAFNIPVPIYLTGCAPYFFIIGPSLNVAQDQLFISLLSISTLSVEITELSRTSPTSFSFVRTLTAPPGYSNSTGQLSKDELNYFFAAPFNSGNSLLYEVSRTTPLDSFDLSTLQQIQGINDPFASNFQPTMSDSLNWVAFVRNTNGLWDGNDLYIALKDFTTSVYNQDKNPISVSLFPNPTSGQFTILLPANNAEITINDMLGQEILKTQATEKKLTLQLDNSGVYFISFKTKDGVFTRKLIVSR